MTADRVPSAVAAVVVLLAGLFEATILIGPSGTLSGGFASLLPAGLAPVLVTVGTALAVGLVRRRQTAAVLLLWAVCIAQLLFGIELMLIQLTIVYVAFAAARWGTRTALWLSALSIPAAAFLLIVMVGMYGVGGLHVLAGSRQVIEAVFGYGAGSVVVFLIGAAALSAPWLAGLAFRFVVDARRSLAAQREAEAHTARADRELVQTREIMRLREEQARLANDVHDVVGHSLAVILAQAESAQYADENDPEVLKETMARIAVAARGSLRDVRQVLTQTRDPRSGSAGTASEPGELSDGLETLIDSVRESGHLVESFETGERRPLPPELETVAFRVLQEMLTNAIRHGRRDLPIVVERRWGQGSGDSGLRIRVRNSVDIADAGSEDMAATTASAGAPVAGDGSGTESGAETGTGGFGLEGMRRRLHSVGGRLEIERSVEEDAGLFTADARLPFRVEAA